MEQAGTNGEKQVGLAEVIHAIGSAVKIEQEKLEARVKQRKAAFEQCVAERQQAKKILPGLQSKLPQMRVDLENLTAAISQLEGEIVRAEHLVESEGSIFDAVSRAEADYKRAQYDADSFLERRAKQLAEGGR
jgi:chromosome segregation ATPase